MRWRWRDLSGTERIGALALPLAVVTLVGCTSSDRRIRRVFDRIPRLRTNLLGFDDEGEADPEPEGIEYDDEPPCRPAPVSMPGTQGAPDAEFCLPPADLEPLAKTDRPFATGGERPKWPLDTHDDDKLRVSYEDVREKWHGRYGRHFGAKRTTKLDDGTSYRRVHVGVDLFAEPGDVVVAPEDGTVIAALPFYKGTGALYLLTDSGIVVNLGEIADGSWTKHGIPSGVQSTRVRAGDAVARVGKSDDGSHMLHVETYRADTTTDEIRHGAMRWKLGDDPPAKVLDPTRYLVRAQRVFYEGV
jgi:hypothetical protein